MFYGLHFFAPRRERVINNYFGMPTFQMWDPFRMQLAMLNCMKPMIIGNMISNLGNSIASMISGRGSVSQCNCNSNNMLSQTMYPYVNFTGTTNTNTTTTTTGERQNGGEEPIDDLQILRDMYKGYRISGPTTNGIYYIKGKDGVPIPAGSYDELTEKLDQLAKADATLKAEQEANEGKENNALSASQTQVPETPASTNENQTVLNDDPTQVDTTNSSAKNSQSANSTKGNDGTNKANNANKANNTKVKNAKGNNNASGSKYSNTVNSAVDELISGIEGIGTNPDKIANVLHNKQVFNKDNVVDILSLYNEKTNNHLWIAIDDEKFYYASSKLEDYQLIVDTMYKRAKETVKDKDALKKIENLRNAMYSDIMKNEAQKRLTFGLGSLLEDTIYIKQFGEALNILKKAEPKK